MTGPLRTKPVVDPGEDVQFSETAGEPLEWQRELDVAIADIDSRLKHPRRKATAVQSAGSKASPSRLAAKMASATVASRPGPKATTVTMVGPRTLTR